MHHAKYPTRAAMRSASEINQRAQVRSAKRAADRLGPYHKTEINTASDFFRALNAGPYAWPGGYPLFFLLSDGCALSFEAAEERAEEIARAIIANDTRDQWHVSALLINYEDGDLLCSHTGKPIPAAYTE